MNTSPGKVKGVGVGEWATWEHPRMEDMGLWDAGCTMWDAGCTAPRAGRSRCLFSDVPEDTSGDLSGTLAV